MRLGYFLLLATIMIGGSCKQTSKSAEEDSLGKLEFNATGKPEAQPAFQKGMLLLHSFEYEDAAEAFQEARKIDPAFVMTYWGEAMTHNHALWQEQDFDKGVAVLQQLANEEDDRVAKAQTNIEKDFVKAVNILYGAGNKAERDSLYAAYMGSLYEKYPGNDEVAAFYSLSLNGWGYTEKNKATLEKAAQIGFEVLSRNPKHPGALHYVIHAYDDPAFAAKALEAADKYAVVAPGAGHALHMPTHIYLSLGMWDKVISSNIVSWNAEHARKIRKDLDNDGLGYHSYQWLAYGYLQKDERQQAKALLDSMKIFTDQQSNKYARAHLVYQKSAYLANTDDYASGVSDIAVDTKDLNIAVRCADWFASGYGAYLQKDLSTLQACIQKMEAARLLEEEKASDKGLRICGNINRSQATKSDIERSLMMTQELQGLAAVLAGDDKAAEACFKKAVDLQLSEGPYSGPPLVARLPFEVYGYWLLDQQRPADALAQFKQSLVLAPNRLLSLKGKQLAEQGEVAMN